MVSRCKNLLCVAGGLLLVSSSFLSGIQANEKPVSVNQTMANWSLASTFQSKFHDELAEFSGFDSASWMADTGKMILGQEVVVGGRTLRYLILCRDDDCVSANLSVLYDQIKNKVYGIGFDYDGNDQHFTLIGRGPMAIERELFHMHITNFEIKVKDRPLLALNYMFGF